MNPESELSPQAPDQPQAAEDNAPTARPSDEPPAPSAEIERKLDALKHASLATSAVLTLTDVRGEDAERAIRRMSRRSFVWAGMAALGGYGALRWLNTRPTDNGLIWPLRRSLDVQDDFARDLISASRLAPQWPRSRAREVQVNGDVGLGDDFDPAKWKLKVTGLAGDDEHLSLAQIKALPQVAFTTEFKCIEGWSTVVNWRGVRLSDFIHRFPPQTQSGDPFNPNKPDDLPTYVGLATPDGAYYVGLERAAALHPQTILCFEMNDQPLSLEHGAPLRLVIPVKYGVKHIKRIGTLSFTNTKPADYWAEQGYGWGDGH